MNEVTPEKYVDRRTLPARLAPMAYRLASLKPGQYAIVVTIEPDNRVKFQIAQFSLDNNKKT